jgi:hypothetical protein
MNISVDNFNEREKFQFLQTKIEILLGFFHILRPIKTWSGETIQKPELKIKIKDVA